jgi:hypothetical protein
MDYIKNCVFIDKAGFHINLKRNWAWSRVGTKAVVTVPLTKAPSHSIIDTISSLFVVHVTLRSLRPVW